MTFKPFFLFLNQLKTLHWVTKSHAHHKILDDAYSDFSHKIDEFVEATIGMNNVQKFDTIEMIVKMPDADEETDYIFETIYREFILGIRKYANTDALQSLIDDLDNIANKTLYLLRMR